MFRNQNRKKDYERAQKKVKTMQDIWSVGALGRLRAMFPNGIDRAAAAKALRQERGRRKGKR